MKSPKNYSKYLNNVVKLAKMAAKTVFNQGK